MHDQPFLVGQAGHPAERALPRRPVGRLVLAPDVGHPVRGPEPVELVGVADPVLPQIVHHTWARDATASATRLMASSIGTPLSW